ncbi:hypothetical protein MNBD_GAMMA26-1454 [hydrothermal vent metagenome]|uniref:CusB-like beta-barrel domain-containing protein n=1 Tax=hydrothermal vent metagenome TaxID=652676 RepID=A0A3B1AV42_9ZZZZ
MDLAALHLEMRRIFDTGATGNEALLKLIQFLVNLTNATSSAYFHYHSDGTLTAGPRAISKQASAWSTELLDELQAAAEKSCETNRLYTGHSGIYDAIAILAAPIGGKQQPQGAMSLALVIGSERLETFATILQLVAGLLLTIEISDTPNDIPQSSRDNAAIRLLAGNLACQDLRTAALHTAEEFASQPDISQAIIGMRMGTKKRCRLQALSGVAEFDPRSELSRRLEAAMDECLSRDDMLQCSADKGDALPILSPLLKLLHTSAILLLPLRAANGKVTGVIILCRPHTTIPADTEYLETFTKYAGAALSTIQAGDPGKLRGTKPHTWGRWLILTLLLSLTAVLWMPVDHTINAATTIQPIKHRFVSAPFAGVLESSNVRPGDLVSAGDPLARMDGREIDWKLNTLLAEQQKAVKKRDVSIATRDTPSAQMAKLEIARLDAQKELLTHRKQNLIITSPIDGLVITGDLRREEGSPLKIGQRLFEIAPLDTMLAEVAVPAADVAYFQNNMPAEIHLESFPSRTWQQPVVDLHPRSVVLDGKNVFIAEVKLDNPDGLLRPGMSGRAQLIGEPQYLWWVLFHRPWERLVTWIFW